MIKQRPIVTLCLFFLSLLAFHSPLFAQSPVNNNLCTQVQCVKIQNGYLWVLSSDNVTYVPYFIKAVGYQPMPIGRHPSDWGYASSDPRSAINNIYNDPAILNRDFTLLQQMNANTVRLWNASNIPAPTGEFPNTMTMTTLTLAQQYNLKVIPGFWVNPLSFDANNNISSTDNLGNTLSAQQIINNFVAFVNTYKGSPGVLFWAIGNENNYQAGLTSQQLTAWYSLVNQMAQAAHNAEGAYFHPVAVVNGEIATIGNPTYGTTDAQMPYLDIWGTNIYRGQSFGTLFTQYATQSQKPLWISEYGIDAFDTTSDTTIADQINDWQLQMAQPSIIAQEGSPDLTTQASWDGSLWGEIFNHVPITIGGSLMEYADEWWGPNEWMCTLPNPNNDPTIQAENVASEAYCMTTHSNFGFPLIGASQDNFTNSQWFGVMAISPNPVAGGADIMTPRPIYNNLQSQWQSNPWSQLTLDIVGSGAGEISTSSSALGAGLNCNFAASSSTGTCTTLVPLNQPVLLNFISTNNSAVTSWGINGCSSGSTSCEITPNTDLTIDLTVSSMTVVNITSPASGTNFTSPANIVINANATASNGHTISSVSFYNGPTLLGTVTTPTGNTYSFTWNNVIAGTYNLTAEAKDNTGAITSSTPISIAVTAIVPPSLAVAIASPVNPDYLVAGSNLTITATASESNGSIAQVAFYRNGVLLGTSTSSPYTYTWNNVPPGYYNLTAIVTDGLGATKTSTAVSIASAVASPQVIISNPIAGSSFSAGSNITLTALADENYGGTISKVAFYNGSTLLGTTTSSSSAFSYTWANVPAGSYSLTAVATDSVGSTTSSSAIAITVTPATAASIVVGITNPVNGSYVVAGSNVTISASASEVGGTISKVTFYNGPTMLGTVTSSPYNYTITNVPQGDYNITAVATDSAGESGTSALVSFVAAAAAPQVFITSPTSGSSFSSGTNINLTAFAGENFGGTISKVAFYKGATLLGTVTSGTSYFTFPWANVAAGTYTLTAVATDSVGTSTTSSSVSISVSAAQSPPVVAITGPANNSTFSAGSNISITATASETNGTIAKVSFYNGSILLGTATSTTGVYTYTWNNVVAGTYNLTAIATDTTGAMTTSAVVAINVTAVAPSSLTVSITSPANQAYIVAGTNLAIAATASETNGTISKVSFYNGGTLLGTSTSSPYTYTWNNVPPGYYNLTAIVTDGLGATKTSTAVSIASAVASPQVIISNPIAGSSFSAGSNITLTALADENYGGTISKVAFYNGSTLLGTTTSSSSAFSYTWANVPAGSYSLTAVATDSVGSTTSSSAIAITVTPATAASIVVGITNPVNGSYVVAGSNVTISASASEVGGTISKVTFYNGPTMLGTVTSSPYNYTITNVPQGDYNITAVATDSAGESGTSALVSFVAAAAAPQVFITSPTSGSSFSSGANINLTAFAAENFGGTISKVDFYYGPTLLGEVTNGSLMYTYTWSNVPAGTYTITASATDSIGTTTTSSPISISVANG